MMKKEEEEEEAVHELPVPQPSDGNTGVPCLTVLRFITLHGCCVFKKPKSRPFTSKMIVIFTS